MNLPSEPMVKSVRVDVGCYVRKKQDFLGIDILRSANVDVQGDATRLPLATSSVDELYSRHTLEHIPDIVQTLRECYRVCSDGGSVELIMPHFTSYEYYNDLSHIRPFAARTFDYYDRHKMSTSRHPEYAPDIDLELVKVELHWWDPDQVRRKRGWKRGVLAFVDRVLNSLANANPFICERFWARWVGGFCEIRFVMHVHKPPRVN